MKKILRIFLITVLFTLSIFPQTSAIYLSAGYNLPTATSEIGVFSSNYEYELNTTTYAKGFLIQGGYQLIVNNNLIFDLNFNYLFGLQNELYYTYSSGEAASYTTSNISISPSIGLKINVGNFSPYAKFGFSLNFISMNTKWESNSNIVIFEREHSYQSDVTFGIFGGIGMNFLIDQHFIPYIESQLNSFTYYPNEVEVTERYPNGTTSKTKYQLVDKLNDDLLQEDVEFTHAFPYSSIGIMVGIRYVF